MNSKKILLSTYDPEAHTALIDSLKESGYDVRVEKTYEKSISYLEEKPDLLILTSRIGAIKQQNDDLGKKLNTFGIPIKLADETLKVSPSQKILYLNSTGDFFHQEYNEQKITLIDFLKRKNVGYQLDMPVSPKKILKTINEII